MDFPVGGGFILVCPGGVSKTGLPAQNTTSRFKPIKWTSSYASLTFNLFAREFPSAGINECGLVVNEMTLTETTYPAEDDRPALIPLQWIQYQLDNCATVEEVLATDSVIRVSGYEDGENRGHHFLVSDSKGESVIIEFIGGKRVIHQGETLSFAALTNATYQDSNEYLARHQGFGGDQRIRLGSSSRDRFVRLADKLQRYELDRENGDAIDYAFGALKRVATGKLTVWSIVFDATNQQVYYRTHANPSIRSLNAKRLFSDVQKSQLVSIDNDGEGEISSRLVDYTTERNLEYAKQFILKYNQGKPPSEKQIAIMNQIATFPESFVRSEE